MYMTISCKVTKKKVKKEKRRKRTVENTSKELKYLYCSSLWLNTDNQLNKNKYMKMDLKPLALENKNLNDNEEVKVN